MKSPPAFQFYPSDYLADMRVRMLSWASRGLYMDLLCYCWREGWIPSDSSAVAQLCHCHDLDIVEPCLSLFDSHPEDAKKLVHKRLDAERNKQKKFSKERSTTGKKGAEARWGKGKRVNGSAIKQPMAKNSSSSSSSTSVCSSTNVELPFPSDGFRESWSSWVDFRIEQKKPLSRTMIAATFKKLSKFSEASALACIEDSISNGYIGLFPKPEPIRTNGHASHPPKPHRAREYPQEALDLPD